MKRAPLVQEVSLACVLFLSFSFFPESAFSASHACGPNTPPALPTELCALTADIVGSRPPESNMTVVPVEKGKRTGLYLKFQCVGATSLQNSNPPSNACFPIHSTGSTAVRITLNSKSMNPTTIDCHPTDTQPGTCSYTLVDIRGSTTGCGPALKEPCPGPPICGSGGTDPCTDTVKIVYNADFPNNAYIKYQAGTTAGVNGMEGRGGELEEQGNSVTFGTKGNTPDTVSLELAFDISGSMDWPAVPGGTIKRIDALKSSTQVLFGILNAYALPGDKLGAVFFSSSATPNATPTSTTPCSGFLPANDLLGADNPTNVGTVAGLVNGQIPTFSTSIGAGLQSADCAFVREANPQNAKKQILLFSDGEQNTAPNVQVVANTTVRVSDNTGANFTDYPSNSATLCTAGQVPCIRICPVTAGRLTAPGFVLQQSIADAVCGSNNASIGKFDPTNPDPALRDPQTFAQADLETFFAQSLTTIVTSDKLEMVADKMGTVTRRAPSPIETFLGASNDVRMTIVLSWTGGTDNDRILPFQLKTPGGTVVDLSQRTSLGRNVSFTTLPFPLFQGGFEVKHQGEWEVVINSDAIHSPSLKYHLMVMADNPTIASEFTINAHDQDIGTGQPIPIQVKLIDNGQPVVNAIVKAQLMGPSNSQGDILSNTPTPSVLNPGPDKAATKGQAKLNALFADLANASLFADKSHPTLTLLDSHNTGVYTGSFTGTGNEGHYYFTVTVRATSATAGDFQRTYQIARFVRSKPDPNKTVFKLLSFNRQRDGSALVKLLATPYDAGGRFLGPGYERDLRVESSGAILVSMDDKLNGTYEMTYRLPLVSPNPKFTLMILGEAVTTITGTGGGRFAAFFDAGVNFPQGTFGTGFNNGFSINAGLEGIVLPFLSVEGIVGYHHFPVNSIAGAITDDLNVYQFSANAKLYWKTIPWGNRSVRLFVNTGPGGYKFGSADTYFGGNAGVGVLFNLTSRFGVQASYNFHAVNTPKEVTKFNTVQGGIRFVF